MVGPRFVRPLIGNLMVANSAGVYETMVFELPRLDNADDSDMSSSLMEQLGPAVVTLEQTKFLHWQVDMLTRVMRKVALWICVSEYDVVAFKFGG